MRLPLGWPVPLSQSLTSRVVRLRVRLPDSGAVETLSHVDELPGVERYGVGGDLARDVEHSDQAGSASVIRHHHALGIAAQVDAFPQGGLTGSCIKIDRTDATETWE